MVFAMTSSSAASERVFSLVDSMFGQGSLSSLADQLQGSVMLKYNKRHARLARRADPAAPLMGGGLTGA